MKRHLSRQVVTCILITGLFLLTPIISMAEDKDPASDLEQTISNGPTISDLLAFAHLRNPSIQAARQAWKSVVEQYRVMTGWPDPQIMVTYFTDPIETRLGPQDWNATITQSIPFPGKLAQTGKVVAAKAQIARLNLDKTSRDVDVAVLASFHELAYIRTARDIAEQNMALVNHLQQVGETAFAQDRAALVDMVKAQSQTAQLRYDALLLNELEQTEQTRLNSLLDREPQAIIGPLEAGDLPPLAYTLEEIYSLAQSAQTEIRIADADVEKARAGKNVAMLNNFPDFRIGLFYASIGEPDMATMPEDAGRDAVGIQFGVNVPLWFGKSAGRAGAAAADLKKAEAEKTAAVTNSRALVHSVYFKLKNAERLVLLYRDELLPQAERAMETAETWFQQNQGSFSDFVETQAVHYNFQLALARSKADQGKLLARLEALAGRSLTRVPPSGIDPSPAKEVAP